MTGAAGAKLPGLLLAAGASRRMGRCKLTLPLGGRPLVVYALEAALAVLDPVVAVLGPDPSPELLQALGPRPAEGEDGVRLVTASQAPLGQAESLKAGLRRVLELEPRAPGVMVLLGDQPLVTPGLLRRLAEAFGQSLAAGEEACVAPSFGGRRGNPVILHRALFPAALRLEGDAGARSLLAAFPLRLVACHDDACLADVDTPELYARLARRFS